MNYELGGSYIGQMIGKKAMHDAMNGKPKKKSKSIISRALKVLRK